MLSTWLEAGSVLLIVLLVIEHLYRHRRWSLESARWQGEWEQDREQRRKSLNCRL